MNQAPDDGRSGLHQQLLVLKRRRGIIVVCVAVAAVAALVVSLLLPTTYTASASLLFRNPGFDQSLFGNTVLAPSSDPSREAATNVRLVSLDVIAQRTAKALDLPRSKVIDQTTVQAEGVSNVVQIAVEDQDPALAARIANTFAAEYIAFRRDADRAKIQSAQADVARRLRELPPGDRTSSVGKSVERTGQQLATLKALQTGNAELVQPATRPTTPSSPRVVRNVVLAILAGLVLGLLLAFLQERLDRRLHSDEDVSERLGVPSLGLIPMDPSLATLATFAASSGVPAVEAVRLLRANLRYYDLDRQLNMLVVTSGVPGEGKTTVSWTIAATIAQSGPRVLLVEADLRHPSLVPKLGVEASLGLSSVLIGDVTFEDALKVVPVSTTPGPGGRPPTMDVLQAGITPPNPSQLLESEQMSALLDRAEADYDVVIVDTPPVTIIADAIPLMKRASGVLVVARIGVTTTDSLQSLRNVLDNTSVEPLGVVVNGARSGASYDAYGYGYGPPPGAASDAAPVPLPTTPA